MFRFKFHVITEIFLTPVKIWDFKMNQKERFIGATPFLIFIDCVYIYLVVVAYMVCPSRSARPPILSWSQRSINPIIRINKINIIKNSVTCIYPDFMLQVLEIEFVIKNWGGGACNKPPCVIWHYHHDTGKASNVKLLSDLFRFIIFRLLFSDY